MAGGEKNKCKKSLPMLQGELEKLYSMKQELQQAAHRCDNMGSMESLDKLDTSTEPSALADFADQVSTSLQECIGQVSYTI